MKVLKSLEAPNIWKQAFIPLAIFVHKFNCWCGWTGLYHTLCLGSSICTLLYYRQSDKTGIDSKDITTKFQEYFTQIKDPRVKMTRYHLLTDIITIAILAVIAGAQGWEDIQEYGLSKEEWLKTFLELPFGIPSPDTFRRVFERLKKNSEVRMG
ncbi:hypothetical protein A6V25_35700 [Nostoc sp. ATCC 53789]|nr:hypothetical protein A6V25_35700 [Nostoc sp. ATCC 53789]